jgi:hypothetical protein
MKLDWLTKHRQKPKHVRDNIAFTVSASFTGVLAVLWFLFGSQSQLFDSAARNKASSPEAFSTFWSQLTEQMSAARESLPDEPATSTSAFPTAETLVPPEQQATYESLQREAIIRVVPTEESGTATSASATTSSVVY